MAFTRDIAPGYDCMVGLRKGPVQVVFCDSRAEMEGVYRHSVERARLQPFLVALDAHLGDLAGGADDALVPLLATGLLEAAVAAISRILLDGGPYRYCCTSVASSFLPIIMIM